MKWKTAYNAKPSPGEVNTRPSQTLPNQALQISEILARYANGMPLTVAPKTPVYEGENDLPDMSHMDKIERIETVRAMEAELLETAERLKKEKLAREKKKADHGSSSERTTGEGSDQGSTSDPDNPISEKNRPAGEADTRGSSKDSGKKKH